MEIKSGYVIGRYPSYKKLMPRPAQPQCHSDPDRDPSLQGAPNRLQRLADWLIGSARASTTLFLCSDPITPYLPILFPLVFSSPEPKAQGELLLSVFDHRKLFTVSSFS